MGPAYKIVEMAAGSKSFTPELPAGQSSSAGLLAVPLSAPRPNWKPWVETFWVFALLEAVMWTPRSFGHSILIALVTISPLWLTWRSRLTLRQLGLAWPSRPATLGIVLAGAAMAAAFPLVAMFTGHPVPANADWPRLGNILPYILWAFFQQFLLQSFFYLRMESVVGPIAAMWLSTALFTIAHLPNLPLTLLTFFGALFFTDLFRRVRSIYPLGLVHAMLGIAIAYSFPDSIMHHMRVGLSFGKF
jgi:membrane protease YdiL (CAAX protease family)